MQNDYINNEYSIKVENVSKTYKLYNKPVDRLCESLSLTKKIYHKKFNALSNVTFEVKKGEIIGIVGKNGSGKSTLLKIITGVITPTEGNVYVNGKISALLELGAGFNPELSGIENIYLNGLIMGFSKDKMKEKVQEIVDFADIGEFINQPVKLYSSGMFARLAFAVSINVDPEILIIDEALSVGDIRFRQKCIAKMTEFMKRGRSILFVTHDIVTLNSFCNRAIWLKDGCLYMDGAPKKVTECYNDYMIHGLLPDNIKNANNFGENANGVFCKSKSDNKSRNKNERSDDNHEKIDKLWTKIERKSFTTTGECYIDRIAFFDATTNKKIDIIDETIYDVYVWFEVECEKDIEAPLIGIGFFDCRGLPLILFNSYSLGLDIPDFKKGGKYIFKARFNMPKFRNGEYTVSLGIDSGIFGEHRAVCRTQNAYVFKVIRKDLVSKQNGLILFNDVIIDWEESRR